MNGAALPAWLTFNATTQTFSGTPTSADLGNVSVQVTATDPANLSASETFNIAVAATAPTTASLFTASDTPTLTAVNDHSPIELGVQFTSSVAGQITALKFYRSASDTGPDLLDLWSSTGAQRCQRHASPNTTASGWQAVNLATPVSIAANTTYVASYHTNGAYAATGNFFTNTLTSGTLTAPSSASVSGGNGVYASGGTSTAGLFPASTFSASITTPTWCSRARRRPTRRRCSRPRPQPECGRGFGFLSDLARRHLQRSRWRCADLFGDRLERRSAPRVADVQRDDARHSAALRHLQISATLASR